MIRYNHHMAFPSAAAILTKLENNDAGFISELTSIIMAIGRKWNWSDCDDINDIAQECYLKLLQNLRSGKFRGDSVFKTYLYAIIRNTCLDH
ncbi:MAG: sigma factor, partial [bacterium]